MSNDQQLLRAIKPEAEITIDSNSYNIGGLYGQIENEYIRRNGSTNLLHMIAIFIFFHMRLMT